MARFQDLMLLHEAGLRQVLREVLPEVLVPALRAAQPELRERILNLYPNRARTLLLRRIEATNPPVAPTAGAEAQLRILAILERLEKEGKVSFLPEDT
jgi:flagellar motor switch protein FliG